MKRSLKSIILTLCCLSCCCVYGQYAVDRNAADIMQRINERFNVLDSLIFPKTAPSPASSAYGTTFANIDTVTARESAINEAIGRRVNAEIDEFKSDLGLQLTGQTYYRFDGLMGADEEDPVSAYNGKVQIEARWYVLQSSLYKREGNINAIRLQGEIDRTRYEKDRLDVSVYQQKEYFRAVSDSLLSGVLQHHIDNLAVLSEANLYLLDRGDISSDELLRILDSKAEAERQLATLRPGMPAATDLSGIVAYTIDVDTAAMMHYISDTAVDIKLLRLQLQLLEQQEKNTSYWTKCNLAPFIRYSYYTRNYAPNSSNIDAGLSFTVPLNTTASHQRRTLHARRQVLEAENIDILQQVNDKIRYYATEIDRLNRASVGEMRRMDELKGYLTIRAHAYDNRNGEYNRLSRLKEYNNYLVCFERLISFQYQRDCYVADLQRLLNTGSILDFCTEHRIEPMPADKRTLSLPVNKNTES